MVYEKETLELCHELTEEGKEEYRKMLEKKADEILFKHNHPFIWLVQKTLEIFKFLKFF